MFWTHVPDVCYLDLKESGHEFRMAQCRAGASTILSKILSKSIRVMAVSLRPGP